MAEKVIETQYPHTYDADGHRLQDPCMGYIDLVCDTRIGVYMRCNLCGSAYKLAVTMFPDSLTGK